MTLDGNINISSAFKIFILNGPFALVDHVINFLYRRKQFAFENFCEQELKEHVKIR